MSTSSSHLHRGTLQLELQIRIGGGPDFEALVGNIRRLLRYLWGSFLFPVVQSFGLFRTRGDMEAGSTASGQSGSQSAATLVGEGTWLFLRRASLCEAGVLRLGRIMTANLQSAQLPLRRSCCDWPSMLMRPWRAASAIDMAMFSHSCD